MDLAPAKPAAAIQGAARIPPLRPARQPVAPRHARPAGTRRHPHPHRPFAPVDARTTASAQKQNYERLEKEVKTYLIAVNIPAELYDHMIRIPPEKVKILNRDELQRYGLSEDDPYEDAARVAGIAKSMGITAEELIRRQAKANAECSNMSADESARCYTRVLREGR